MIFGNIIIKSREIEVGARIKSREIEVGARLKSREIEVGARLKSREIEVGARLKSREIEVGARLKPVKIEMGGKSFRGPNWILSARFGPKRESAWGLYGVCARFVAHVGSSIGTLVLQGGWDFNIFPPTQILDDFKNLQCYLGSGHIALQFPQ